MVFAGRGWPGPSSAGQFWAVMLFSAGVVAVSRIWKNAYVGEGEDCCAEAWVWFILPGWVCQGLGCL